MSSSHTERDWTASVYLVSSETIVRMVLANCSYDSRHNIAAVVTHEDRNLLDFRSEPITLRRADCVAISVEVRGLCESFCCPTHGRHEP
jgi:hypothetical protein